MGINVKSIKNYILMPQKHWCFHEQFTSRVAGTGGCGIIDSTDDQSRYK